MLCRMAEDLRISRTHVLPGHSLTVRTARASGPGGQHVNRTETKVQLTFDPRCVDWLDRDSYTRLVQLAGRSLDADGFIHITSQLHRDQQSNLEDAREKLKQLLIKALIKPKKRVATKPTYGSKLRRLDSKKRDARTKAGRRKVGDD